MQFLVIAKIHDTLVLDSDKRLREVIAPRFRQILESGRNQGGGFLGGIRGAFFVLEINAPEELYSLLGPEIYGTCAVEAHPIISWEKGAALFREWAEAGR